MSAAQEDILATPELLELILAQLPMRDLLVTAPLVSKTWRATTLVPALQRALFFLPSASSNSEPIQNLLLAAAFPTFFASHAGACYARTFMVMPWNKAPDAFKRPEASWRRMLLTQPPVRGMAITQTYSPRVRRAMLRDPEGLRMGVLYDLGVQFVHRSAASFRILWHHAGDIHFESNLTVAVKEFVPHGCMRAGGTPAR
ncbi:F-box domain protein [Mycena sanguinolenta]|uniref:F-box domain protein n=1 Tax=Mycena sanguinolenta TaxID=230812 RepID=A0A8H6XJV4_9AGAR|nr:F-box domain protein [Mycena sanguinolenta]